MKFLETSAKTSHNVADSFVTMTKEIIGQNMEKEKAMSKNGKIINQEETKRLKLLKQLKVTKINATRF